MHPTLSRWVESSLDAPVTAVEPLLVEASNRRFYRMRLNAPQPGPESLVVMDSPPELERNDAFLAVQRLLADRGLPVPSILAMDTENGFFLLGDLGDRHLEDVYGTPLQDKAIALAIDGLMDLQRIDAPGIPPYLESRFRDELGIFVEWFLGALLDERLPQTAADAFETLVENALGQPQCLIHRDYHCRNLLLTPEGGLGIVDFQDALIGPATYDLACLLWDCYHDFDDGERRRWQRYYQRSSRFRFDDNALSRALDLTGLQRQLKAIGIFARLKLRDGKPGHMRYIAPVLESATRISSAYAGMEELGEWLVSIGPRALGTLD
ncbi:MAG: phosphotransferase [Gammaproteobacteria bacterium]|nr:phosphotransferase [Gammaproteobacteria bacterium]MDE0364085.1 phosphotransferase [Gammaproteobacteria bacterium]